jgi:hypothetical protein
LKGWFSLTTETVPELFKTAIEKLPEQQQTTSINEHIEQYKTYVSHMEWLVEVTGETIRRFEDIMARAMISKIRNTKLRSNTKRHMNYMAGDIQIDAIARAIQLDAADDEADTNNANSKDSPSNDKKHKPTNHLNALGDYDQAHNGPTPPQDYDDFRRGVESKFEGMLNHMNTLANNTIYQTNMSERNTKDILRRLDTPARETERKPSYTAYTDNAHQSQGYRQGYGGKGKGGKGGQGTYGRGKGGKGLQICFSHPHCTNPDCRYDHPNGPDGTRESYSPPECHDFAKGSCVRYHCRFSHASSNGRRPTNGRDNDNRRNDSNRRPEERRDNRDSNRRHDERRDSNNSDRRPEERHGSNNNDSKSSDKKSDSSTKND